MGRLLPKLSHRTTEVGVFWVIFVAVAIIVGVALVLAQRQPVERDQMGLGPEQLMYKQSRPLSEPEQVLYWRLVEALPECVILAQVSFSRFMTPSPPEGVLQAKQQRALYARISQKSVDFLVCLKDFTVVAAVELDDATHRGARDIQRDELLKSAGITPLRLRVDHIPSAETLREMFTASR
jgi:hypothetical protein